MKNLKLSEVIWETTPKCNRFGTADECAFCGSAEFLKAVTDIPSTAKIIQLAKIIAEYPIDSINLSGGEPSILPPDTLMQIIKIFKQKNIQVKILTNGFLFKKHRNPKLYDSLDAIGYSINTLRDIELFNKNEFNTTILNKTTIITNFGTHNIFQFKQIRDYVKNTFQLWQIQLTMGKYQLNAEGIKYLYSLLDQEKDVKFIMADNLQKCHDCTAGLCSCGIDFQGNVIACLSERSFKKDIKSYGNLFERSLKDIWECEFKDIRFNGDFKCCRSCLEYPIEDKMKELQLILEEKSKLPCIDLSKPYVPPYENPPVYVYGVQPPISILYGVWPKYYTTGDSNSSSADPITKFTTTNTNHPMATAWEEIQKNNKSKK